MSVDRPGSPAGEEACRPQLRGDGSGPGSAGCVRASSERRDLCALRVSHRQTADPKREPVIPAPLLRRLPRLAAGALVAALCAAPAAHAAVASTTSTNWSGYAVHRSGVSFRAAASTWRQPAAACLSPDTTYSSFWVGIGGYRRNSDALEQIGTELDCRADGAESSSAWYELVPAAAHSIPLTVRPGDLMSASVFVRDEHVTVKLSDLTRGTHFTRTVLDRTLDVSSAEWIAEAPSNCSGSDCTILPLAAFGTAHFTRASATTASGTRRALTRAPWTRTRISLGSSFEQPAADGGDEETTVSATPSALTDPLGAFAVTYSATSRSIAPAGPTGPPSSGHGAASGTPVSTGRRG